MKFVLRDIKTGAHIHYHETAVPIARPRATDINPRRCGSWRDFERRFDPIDNPLSPDSPLIETLDMVQCPPEHVWTIIEDGCGGLVLCPGWHLVNRFAYVIARNPRVDYGATPYNTYRYD
jgi:hypothetical protein